MKCWTRRNTSRLSSAQGISIWNTWNMPVVFASLGLDSGVAQTLDVTADRVPEHLVPAPRHAGRREAAEVRRQRGDRRGRGVDAMEIGGGRDVPGQDVVLGVLGDRRFVEAQVDLG